MKRTDSNLKHKCCTYLGQRCLFLHNQWICMLWTTSLTTTKSKVQGVGLQDSGSNWTKSSAWFSRNGCGDIQICICMGIVVVAGSSCRCLMVPFFTSEIKRFLIHVIYSCTLEHNYNRFCLVPVFGVAAVRPNPPTSKQCQLWWEVGNCSIPAPESERLCLDPPCGAALCKLCCTKTSKMTEAVLRAWIFLIF